MPPKRPKVGVGKKPVAAAAATKKTPKATEKKKRRRKKQDSWACSDPALGSYRRRQKTSALNSKVAKMERYLREKGEVIPHHEIWWYFKCRQSQTVTGRTKQIYPRISSDGTAKRKPSGKSKAPRAAAPRALAVVTRSRAIKPAGEQQKQEPPPAARRSPRLQ